VAATTQRVHGSLIRKGAVLARTAYRIRSGAKVTLRLQKTALGKKALGGSGVKKATLRIGGTTKTVRIEH
jgi:hypothetical protein